MHKYEWYTGYDQPTTIQINKIYIHIDTWYIQSLSNSTKNHYWTWVSFKLSVRHTYQPNKNKK